MHSAHSKKNILLVLLLLAPACGPRRKASSEHRHHGHGHDTATQVDIPVAGDSVKSFFDEDDLGEFTLVDDADEASLDNPSTINEYAWVEDDASNLKNFKVVYFDFDNYGIKSTQEENVVYDTSAVKKHIKECARTGQAPQVHIVVEGHACHSAGSAIYNLALSEKRAKAVADRLVAAGVPCDAIKLVGRGQEVPAVIGGKMITGSREEQWANRRVELRILA